MTELATFNWFAAPHQKPANEIPDAIPRLSTTQRGYNQKHRDVRTELKKIVDAGEVKCWRCGKQIRPDELWHLGHDDYDRTRYRGAEHPGCNRVGRRITSSLQTQLKAAQQVRAAEQAVEKLNVARRNGRQDYARARWSQRPIITYTLICPVCSQSMIVRSHTLGRRRYCSEACSYEAIKLRSRLRRKLTELDWQQYRDSLHAPPVTAKAAPLYIQIQRRLILKQSDPELLAWVDETTHPK